MFTDRTGIDLLPLRHRPPKTAAPLPASNRRTA
jgi:hypothetical protein